MRVIRHEPRKRNELIPANFEAILDKKLWDGVQELIAERGDLSLRRGNVSDYLLSGIPRCRRCGSAYIGTAGHGKGGRYQYYSCQGRVRQGKEFCDNDALPRHAFESAVTLELIELLAATDIPFEAWEMAKQARKDSQRGDEMEVRRLDRKIAAKKQARSRYHAAFENGDLEPALCNARLAEIQEELAALETRRALVHTTLMAATADFPGDAVDRCLDEIEESD
jgi:site-specific DNA recombinase